MAQFDQLDDDCLMEVMDRLPTNELVKLLGVNRKLNRVATTKLQVKIDSVSLTNPRRPFNHYLYPSFILNTNKERELVLDPKIDGISKKSEALDVAFRDLSTGALFLNWLSKCSNIKSIDFGKFELPDSFLFEVFKRCPELDCIKMSKPVVGEDEWQHVMEQFGSRIVYFGVSPASKLNFETKLSVMELVSRMIKIVAANCPNIKQVTVILGWAKNWTVTSELVAALKKLSKTCLIKLNCSLLNVPEKIVGQLFEDVVNELLVKTLKWSDLGTRFDRLSKLWVYSMRPEDGHGVDFAGLKVLELIDSLSSESVNCFIASRFPLLEEFFLNAAGFTEDNYNALFQKMVSVKKLTILNHYENDLASDLPGLAIRHLNKLETIVINIYPKDWQSAEFFKQLEMYVEIKSLKKLRIELENIDDELIIANEVNRLKMKQSRVEIELLKNVLYNYSNL